MRTLPLCGRHSRRAPTWRAAVAPLLLTLAFATPASGSIDPCAVVSKSDVASAAGASVDQVYTPTRPSKNECTWAVAAHGGLPAQDVALTLQTFDQAKSSHGMARFGAILNAIGTVPGLPIMSNPIVSRAFADAQVVNGLGERAAWKNGTLSVLKNETLLEIRATGQPGEGASLGVSRAIAEHALTHLDVTGKPSPSPSGPV